MYNLLLLVLAKPQTGTISSDITHDAFSRTLKVTVKKPLHFCVFYCFYVLSMLYCYCIDVCTDVRLSHLNKDYGLCRLKLAHCMYGRNSCMHDNCLVICKNNSVSD